MNKEGFLMTFSSLIIAKSKVKNPFQFTLYRLLKSAMVNGLFQKDILKSEKLLKNFELKFTQKVKKPVGITIQIAKTTPDNHPLQVKFTMKFDDEWSTVEYFKGKTVKWHYEPGEESEDKEEAKAKSVFKKSTEALNKALMVIVKKEKKGFKK